MNGEDTQEVPGRDPNPRGPDAPQLRGEQIGVVQEKDDHSFHLLVGPLEAVEAIAPPSIRWVGTNYNYDAGRSGGIAGIVLHTEVGTNTSATGRFQTPGQASAHYGVAYDGSEVVQWVAEGNVAWHCGRYYPDAGHMGNTNSIGIEHEDRGNYNSPRPDGLYEASARLVAWIATRYGLPINFNTVRGECGHRDVSVVGTACPDSLDIGRIIARAQQIATPTPPPAWKVALKAEAYVVTLDKSVPLYDLRTTGAAVGQVGPGPVAFAYRGTIAGLDYRVTQYSFDHDTPHGVLTADVTPTPEWKTSLSPQVFEITTTKVMQTWNLENGVELAPLAPGPLVFAYRTSVKGVAYRLTSYAIAHNEPRGVKAEDLVPVIPPVPEWRANLRPWLKGYILDTSVPLQNMETGALIAMISGTYSPAFVTSVKGRVFLVTSFSISKNLPNGVLQVDAERANRPSPSPTPPDPVPGPVDPSGPIPGAPAGFFAALMEFLRKFFGGK